LKELQEEKEKERERDGGRGVGGLEESGVGERGKEMI